MTRLVALGLFVLIASAYAISGPGRIDMIDGQYRYDVTRNIVQNGSPIITDTALPPTPIGRDGRHYFLGPAPSIVALPLVAIGNAVDSERPPLLEFMFSFTSALIAAFGSVLLYAIYGLLGVARRRAVGWTLVAAFATLTWPLATSVFDQAQQGTALLLAVWAGIRAARDNRIALAVLAGFAASVLISYQEVYIATVPAIALACRAEGESLRGYICTRRLLGFGVGFAVGIGALVAFNYWRFGSFSAIAPNSGTSFPLIGNPLVGAAALLVSPGKSILLFSPPILLAAAGARGLLRERRTAAIAIFAIVASHFAIISCVSFFGGDWAWGPRYLVVTLPLTCIAFPFARLPRMAVGGIIAIGVVVQLLAVSVDHQRWFFANRLDDHFWVRPSIYFEKSQLLERPSELATVLATTGTVGPRHFAPNPYRSPTYTTFGNDPRRRDEAPEWMKQFALFWLPRPWPLWMPRVTNMPIDYGLALIVTLLGLVGGAGLLGAGLRASRPSPSSSPTPPAPDRSEPATSSR